MRSHAERVGSCRLNKGGGITVGVSQGHAATAAGGSARQAKRQARTARTRHRRPERALRRLCRRLVRLRPAHALSSTGLSHYRRTVLPWFFQHPARDAFQCAFQRAEWRRAGWILTYGCLVLLEHGDRVTGLPIWRNRGRVEVSPVHPPVNLVMHSAAPRTRFCSHQACIVRKRGVRPGDGSECEWCTSSAIARYKQQCSIHYGVNIMFLMQVTTVAQPARPFRFRPQVERLRFAQTQGRASEPISLQNAR